MRVEHFLERSAAGLPDKTAIVCANQRRTYHQVDEQASRVAHALLEIGLKQGDRVALCLENSIEAVVSLFGVLKAGGVFVIINPRVRVEQLAYLLADSGAVALITRGGRLAGVSTATSRFTDLKTIFVVGNDRMPPVPPGARAISFEDAVRRHQSGITDVAQPRPDTDLAALVYTSGSTGRPKGVMLTHRNMTSAAVSICTYLENTSDDVILNVLPLAFTYGLGQVTTAFCAGATLVLEPSVAYPAAVVEAMRREQVTGFALVPTIATLLLRQDLRSSAFPRLRYITNAAAALSTGKCQRLREAFPGAQIYSMYGQTECQRVSYLPPNELAARPASVGIAIPGTETYIVDEDGNRVDPGIVGELVVRGPHVMRGYWNQPKATDRVLRPGSVPGEMVLYTGDLFRMDNDGFLYFVERRDDVIKTRGEKVAPREVEDVIARVPGVAEVAVYGIPNDLLGEAIAAVVALAPGAFVTRERIQRYCLEHLDAFMVPQIVDIRDALPTTMSGKVSRRALRMMVAPTERVCG